MNRIILDPNNPLHLIPATLATNPGAVAVIPVFLPAYPNNSLVLSAKTRLRRLPPELAAHIAAQQAAQGAEAGGNGDSTHADLPTHIEVGRLLLTIPADVAANLRGPMSERDPMFLFLVRRDVYDAAIRQADSGLVLPTVVPAANAVMGSGPRIIKP